MPTPPSRSRRLPARLAAAGLLLGSLAAALAAVSPDDQLEFADGLFLRGMYDLAEGEYQALLRTATNYAKLDQALFRLAECYRNLTNPAAANLFYQRVIREFPDSPMRPKADLSRAELLIETDRPAEAAAILTPFLASRPPADLAVGARYYLGVCAAQTGDAAAAEKEFRAVLEAPGETPFASLAALDLAALFRKAGAHEDEQEKLYRRAADRPASPVAAAEAWLQLGNLEFRRERYPEASAAYGTILKDFASTPHAALVRLPAAWAAYRTGKYTDALKLADDHGDGPESADEWLYLKANCQRQLLDPAAADTTYEKLIADHPKSPHAAAAAYERALIAFRGQDYAEAVRRASAVEPDASYREDLLWLLAESYVGMADTNNAVQQFRLLADAPQPGPRAGDALYRLGRLLQERGDVPGATDTFRRLAERFPRHEAAPQALIQSGYLFAQAGKFEEAVTDWTRVAREYPDHPLAEEALYQKALGELRLQREAPARETLAALLTRFPKTAYQAESRFWLATLLEKAGETGPAETELRAALALSPQPEWDRRIRYRLAGVLQKRNQLPEAADLLQGLLGTPSQEEMTPALLEWLARLRLDRNEFPQAEAAARELLANAGGASADWAQVAWYLTGVARAGAGQTAPAIEAFTKAADTDARTADGARARQRLGDLLREGKQFAAAVARYQEALERANDPGLLDIKARSMYGLGRAAEDQQQWEDARRWHLGVAILFDHPDLTPECLWRAAGAFAKLGQNDRRDQTLAELAKRYPKSPWNKPLP